MQYQFEMINTSMEKSIDSFIFRSAQDFWQISENIKNIYYSDSSLVSLLDFERVLDELDLYAFKNWEIGELVSGPVVSKYRISCIFMWPENLMPDPRGARRLLPFDCEVKFKKTDMKVPVKINTPSDYRPGTHKARIVNQPVWLVEITIPKRLISEIKTGSIEFEDKTIDVAELDSAYEQGLDDEQYRDEGFV
jgi:hypothetical protein